MRVKSELHVAASLYLQCPYYLEGTVTEHVVFLVREGLAGSHDYGVSRMDAYRVEILHVAYGDGSVIGISHHLVLDLLISLNALFHQDLMDGGECEGVLQYE